MTESKKSIVNSIIFLICAVALIYLGIGIRAEEQWFDKPLAVLAILVGLFALVASIGLFLTRHHPGSDK